MKKRWMGLADKLMILLDPQRRALAGILRLEEAERLRAMAMYWHSEARRMRAARDRAQARVEELETALEGLRGAANDPAPGSPTVMAGSQRAA